MSLSTLLLAGAPDTFKHILFEFTAGGSEEVYDYIVKYFAHAVQRPLERAGVMLMLDGAQATFKSYVLRTLAALDDTSVTIYDNFELIGRFNDHLEGATIINLDEACFAGSRLVRRRAVAIVADLISRRTILINARYQPRRMVENYARVLATSNNAQLALDFRRRAAAVSVLDAGNLSAVDKTELYNRCEHQMKQEGGLAALKRDLERVELGDWTPMVLPECLRA